jgi:hypothetical protein
VIVVLVSRPCLSDFSTPPLLCDGISSLGSVNLSFQSQSDGSSHGASSRYAEPSREEKLGVFVVCGKETGSS